MSANGFSHLQQQLSAKDTSTRSMTCSCANWILKKKHNTDPPIPPSESKFQNREYLPYMRLEYLSYIYHEFTPPKTNMTMEHPPFEDVFPMVIFHLAMLVYWGVEEVKIKFPPV